MTPCDHDPRFRLAERLYLEALEIHVLNEVTPAPEYEGPDPDEAYERRRDRAEWEHDEAACRCANCRWGRIT